ncbi:MAG: hypothetical protein F6J98_20125 [Moorea sp. SIO4G2]|nr:hypothetical protein [Moorena sp. SIO4G2]
MAIIPPLFNFPVATIAVYTLIRYTGFFPSCIFPIPYSLFPVPCSLFPVPCSLLPAPCSLFPVPFNPLPMTKRTVKLPNVSK